MKHEGQRHFFEDSDTLSPGRHFQQGPIVIKIIATAVIGAWFAGSNPRGGVLPTTAPGPSRQFGMI
jgi:hypothetical protein